MTTSSGTELQKNKGSKLKKSTSYLQRWLKNRIIRTFFFVTCVLAVGVVGDAVGVGLGRQLEVAGGRTSNVAIIQPEQNILVSQSLQHRKFKTEEGSLVQGAMKGVLKQNLKLTFSEENELIF